MIDTIHRFDTIDLDTLRFDGDTCPVRNCDLEEGHDGNHVEVNPYSGLVYHAWEGEYREVSERALRVANKINRLRDAILEAIDESQFYRHAIIAENVNLTYDDDPALYKMIHDLDIWPHHSDPNDSGFEGYSAEQIRDEMIDLYELDGGE